VEVHLRTSMVQMYPVDARRSGVGWNSAQYGHGEAADERIGNDMYPGKDDANDGPKTIE